MKNKNSLKADRPKIITRRCVICSDKIQVKVFPDGKYVGGNYFYSVSECGPDGNCSETRKIPWPTSSEITSDLRDLPFGEYRECDKCYKS